jgi:hypothetical protein
MKMIKGFRGVVVFLVLFSSCTGKEGSLEKLERAEAYLRSHGGSAHYRALAYALYQSALPGLEEPSQRYRAYFGLGTIPLLDLLQAGVFALVTPPSSPSSPPSLPPELLYQLLDHFITSYLQERILDFYAPLTVAESFRFSFENLTLPNPLPGSTLPVDLSGVWDQGDIALIYGTLELILGLWHYLKAYPDLVPFLLKLLTFPEPPSLPTVPPEIPPAFFQWVSRVTEGRIPWLDQGFATLRDPEEITRSQSFVLSGLDALLQGFSLTETEATPPELALIAREDTLFHLALRFDLPAVIGFPGELLEVPLKPLSSSLFRRIVATARESFTDPATAFTFPKEVWELLKTAIQLLGKSRIPSTPIELRFPALRLSYLYASPVTDLKALLPLRSDGRIAFESEVEPWEDENQNGVRDCQEPYEDIGVEGAVDSDNDGNPDLLETPQGKGNRRWDDPFGVRDGTTLPPLYHRNPREEWEPPNGVVNPLYLFFPDPTFGGVLVPLAGSDTIVSPDLTRTYTNPDLNRFLSLLWGLITVLGAGSFGCP